MRGAASRTTRVVLRLLVKSCLVSAALLRRLLANLICLHANIADLARRSYDTLPCGLAALFAGEISDVEHV